jgi:flagellar biogenesis protein FliO
VLWLCLVLPALAAGSNEAAVAGAGESTSSEPVAPRDPPLSYAPVAASRRQAPVDSAGRRPLFPSLARSGRESTDGSPSRGGQSWILTTCTALAAVVALIFVVRAVIVRFTGRAAAATQSPLLEVLSRVSVAPRSHILIIRLGQRVIAVADGAAGMRTLADIDDPDEVAELLRTASTVSPRSATTAFRTLLHRFHGDYGQGDRLDGEGGDSHEYQVDRARDQVSGLVSRIRKLGGGGGA